ncbi:MAG TPA: multiheme c-type cytochrome [Terriglobales bacterium]|nr:multiheme c-type cytochrome [Terriglobales bacterium]
MSTAVASRGVLSVCLLLPAHSLTEEYTFLRSVSAAEARYVGPGSCSAAACHGSVQVRRQTKVLQNEYSTWILQDKHARAWNVLNSLVSQRIASILGPASLGAADAAHAPKCLACHALYVRNEERARDFDITDGVSCESCHGPSSLWLGPHTARDWSHEKSIAMGMYDTKNLRLRTEKCLACHLGTADKYVDHEMIAAGHPDLVFELDSFQAIEPVHWVEKTRAHADQPDKDPLFGVRAWSLGQAVQLRESMNRLIRRAKGTEGQKGPVWPEYSELDCFACHHSLTPAEDSWRLKGGSDGSQGGRGFYGKRRAGDPAYNISRVVVFQHMANEVDASTTKQLQETMGKIAALVGSLQPDRSEIERLAGDAYELSGRLADELANTRFDREKTLQVMRAISADADYVSGSGERGAEQAAMALDSLYIAYSKESSPNPEVRAAINGLFQLLENPSAYNAPKFAAGLKRVNAALR